MHCTTTIYMAEDEKILCFYAKVCEMLECDEFDWKNVLIPFNV